MHDQVGSYIGRSSDGVRVMYNRIASYFERSSEVGGRGMLDRVGSYIGRSSDGG